ncbi:MAG: tetratricopeptide repeat protein [Gammaproteobacteria bacterium]|nr:tetratricopeptide repeat protein [Gammaproteobacteria bacterium]
MAAVAGRGLPPWQAMLLLCWLPMAALADALSELPSPWGERLEPVAESDLSGAEPTAREAMDNQREATARLLDDANAAAHALGEAYGRLGALYHVHGLTTTAEACYGNAMTLEPERFRWAYYAARLAATAGRHATALERLEKARALRPDYPPLSLRRGESLLELGRLDEAAAALERAGAVEGLRPRALLHLAQIDLLRRRPEVAIPRLREVLELAPEADAAHYPLARALRATGADAAARAHMARRGGHLPPAEDPLAEQLAALDQGARRHFAEGLRAGRERDFTAAAAAFARGLEIQPDNIDARVSHARALFLAGDPDSARAQLESALTAAPDHTLALFLSALVREHGGETERAVARYRRVLALDPAHYGAHFCLANRLYTAGDYAAAARHYAAALEANPDIPPARLYGLLARKRAGMIDAAALARLEAMVDAHPEDQALRYALIRLLVLAEPPTLRDSERARRLVNALVQEAFVPPHVELQALVAAAVGAFAQALELQEQALPALLWTAPSLAGPVEAAREAYRQERLPAASWYDETAVLQPPRTDVRLMMMEYPAPVPY